MDLVRASAAAGRLVLWEECARDGAQGKTLLDGAFRAWLARRQGRIFGADGPRHVVFAAGFPSVCGEEFEATRRTAVEAEGSVSAAAVCRGTPADVRTAQAAVRGVSHARVMPVVPASEATARALVHRGAREALEAGVDLVKAVADPDLALDVCLADVPRADPDLVAEYARRLTEAGAATVVLADTVGELLPWECDALFGRIRAQAGPDVVLVSHLHNDLGLGLANTLAALRAGIRVAACSWLGIAERSGMVATEQLLFLLAYRPDRVSAVLGADADLWWTAPDLTLLPEIAERVSAETGVPLSVTTPIVGQGVGTISTGTPFTHPQTFQPYDPEALLGVRPRVVLTHLASRRVVAAAALRLGFELDAEQTATALDWAKSRAYRTRRAVVPDADFAAYLEGLTHRAL